MTRKLKNDRYRRARGGKAFLVQVHCSDCKKVVLLYQKDGDGRLKRCYLNRIMAPPELERLQRSKDKNPERLPKLACVRCEVVLGTGIRHHDGRLAFRLHPNFFFTKRIKKENQRARNDQWVDNI